MTSLRCALALVLLQVATGAWAKLQPTYLVDVIAESDLIIEAIAIEINEGPFKSGSAVMRIEKVLMGSSDSDEIKLRWSSEVHEATVSRSGVRYILFLKWWPKGQSMGNRLVSKGEYRATHYGRGYVPLVKVVGKNGGLALPAGPNTIGGMRLPKGLATEANVNIWGSKTSRKRWVVRLEAILDLIKASLGPEIKGSKKSDD